MQRRAYRLTLAPRLLLHEGSHICAPPQGVRLLQIAAPAVKRRVFAAVRQGSAQRPSVVLVLDALERAADDVQKRQPAMGDHSQATR